MLQNLSFQRKIATLVVVALVGLLAIALESFFQNRGQMLEGHKGALRSAVQSATGIAKGYQALAASGKMPEPEAKAAAIAAIKQARYGPDNKDYFYIWSLDGVGVMHPIKPEWDGQNMVGKVKDSSGVDIITALVDGMKASGNTAAFIPTNFPRPGSTEPVPELQLVMAVPGWNWMVGSGVYTDDVAVQMRGEVLQLVGVLTLALLVMGGLGIAIVRNVMAQLGGDPDVAIAAMARVADGDLSVEVPAARAGSLLDSLNRMVASVRSTVTQVQQATENIGTASAEIATGNQNLSVRTENTASNLQDAASSIEQLTATVNSSAQSAREADQLAAQAAQVAVRGGEAVQMAVSTMDEINASSQKIADIIGVIDGIAFQTNILALNAAVEAARAGEQGRGFAVVAGEVRTLAQRSAQAAKEIKGLIDASTGTVATGSKIVADAGRTMEEIVGSVQRVSQIIAEISSAAAEQSAGIRQVNGAVNQLDQMTQQNAALVEQSAAAASSLKQQAGTLMEVVGTFRLGAGRGLPALAHHG